MGFFAYAFSSYKYTIRIRNILTFGILILDSNFTYFCHYCTAWGKEKFVAERYKLIFPKKLFLLTTKDVL